MVIFGIKTPLRGLLLNLKTILVLWKSNSSFTFKHTSDEEVKRLLLKIDCKKKTSGAIPSKILCENADICSKAISKCINHAIDNNEFPSKLKKADIIPIHKKEDTSLKSNYRPISILPAVSKIFEKVMYSQLYQYMQDVLNPIVCGFRKGHNTQYPKSTFYKIGKRL